MTTKCKVMKNFGQYLRDVSCNLALCIWIADSNCVWVLENNFDTCLFSIWLHFFPPYIYLKNQVLRRYGFWGSAFVCVDKVLLVSVRLGCTFVKWSVVRLSTLDKPTTALLVSASLLHPPTLSVVAVRSWFISCINICRTYVHLSL